MEVEPFRLKPRLGSIPDTLFKTGLALQASQSSTDVIETFCNELSKRYPCDTCLETSQQEIEAETWTTRALKMLQPSAKGPQEAFFDNNIEEGHFLRIYSCGSLLGLHLILPVEARNEVLRADWGSQVSENVFLVFLPRSTDEFETVFSIVYEGYLFAKGASKFVIPNGLNLPRLYNEEEEKAVLEVVRSGFMSRYSSWDKSKVHLFEQAAAQYLGVKHCLMLNSGTASLICALAGLNIGPGDQVLVSCFTWISTAAAIIAVGAIPIIYEIDESLGPDLADIRKKTCDKTKAVIVTHMMGSACHMDEIVQLVQNDLNLKLIEDCCQSVGGKYKGRHLGTFGDAGTWSMNYHKNICVGEGGLLFTNSRDVYERAWSASEPAFQEPHTLGSVTKSPSMYAFFSQWSTEHFVHSTCRGSELAGALGLAQLPKLDPQLNHTRQLRRQFLELLGKQPPRNFILQPIGDQEGDCGINVAILLHHNVPVSAFVAALKAEQISLRPIFTLKDRDNRVYYWWDSILQQKGMSSAGYPWKDQANSAHLVCYSQDMCSKSLDIMGRTLCFSFSLRMTPQHVELMANALIYVDQHLPIDKSSF